MAENKIDKNSIEIGASKERSILGIYQNEHSSYSTQDGNATLGGTKMLGGYSGNTYERKYVGGDGSPASGKSIQHTSYEVYSHVLEQPEPVTYYGG